MGLYCGIDLHSNNHVLTVIDEADRRVYERRLPNDLAITKAALEPYRAELVAVAVDWWKATRMMIHPGMASIHGCWLDAPRRRITDGLGRRFAASPCGM